MATNNEEYVATLISMGFDREQSTGALNASAGNLEYAIDALLSISTHGGGFSNSGGGVTSFATSDDDDYGDAAVSVRNTCSSISAENFITDAMTRAVHCNESQYNNSTGLDGRSACTAIALTMGCKLLTRMNDAKRTTTDTMLTTATTVSLENFIDPEFLSVSIQEGIRLHHRSLVHKSGVEHISVEELLLTYSSSSDKGNSSDEISSLRQYDNSPRQGILTNASLGDNPIGLEGTLRQCQLDATDQHSYIAVVITKPPESVLILLPPLPMSSSSSLSSLSPPYVLLDSHPRPQQLSPHYPTGSYALYHSSLQALVASLHQIFPAIELGSDVPEMMAMMYNSFDAYPFQYTSDDALHGIPVRF